MAYTVYCHTFPNGKKYIGITGQSVSRRWRNGEGYEGQPVYNAILKFRWENIKHEILFENLSKEAVIIGNIRKGVAVNESRWFY